MSTITVTNIKATGETASRAATGVAAAWCNFNGIGTIAIRDSINIASLTDRGTGLYTLNYTSNMANSSYSSTGNATHDGTDNTQRNRMATSTALAPSNCPFNTFDTAGVADDVNHICNVTHGDLA